MAHGRSQITRRKYLSESEQAQLIKVAKDRATTRQGRRAYLIISLLLNTGLRATELARLRLEDTPDYLGSNDIEVQQGKYGSRRFVPISQRLADAIRTYIKKDRSFYMPRWVRKKNPKGYLFWTQTKKPLLKVVNVKNPKTGKLERQERASASLYELIKRYGIFADLGKPLHPHVLRHTFGTNALSNPRIGLVQTKNLMGHAHVTTTDKYTHAVSVRGLGEILDRD